MTMPPTLACYSTSLQEANYHVLVAQDGESALERLRYTKPDLVLLDVMMPGINGFETLGSHQKKIPPQPPFPSFS